MTGEGASGQRPGWLSRLRRECTRLLGLAPVLDLHGLGVADAVRATESFLAEAAAASHDEVRIVYGKGRHSPGGVGVLRSAVPDLVAARTGSIVRRFERQVESDGRDGAMRVWLHPPGERARSAG